MPDGSLRRAQQAEQDADRRRLAGSVRAQEPVHLTLADGEVEPVQGSNPAEVLDQPGDVDGDDHPSTLRKLQYFVKVQNLVP